MVIGYHIAALMKTPVPEYFHFIENYFGLGVPLFYTLSGFVLAYGFASSLTSPGQVRAFYIRRLARIAPLFYSISLLWIVIDLVVWKKSFPFSMIFLNFSFMFGLVPGFHESIPWAGWSVGVEMLFYAAFPIVIGLISNSRMALFALVASMILSAASHSAFTTAGLGGFAYMNLCNQLPFFVAGIMSFRIWETLNYRQDRNAAAVLFCGAAILAIVIVNSERMRLKLVAGAALQLGQNIWAVVFAALLLSSCLAKIPFLERGPLRQFGKVSFSAYLLHPLIMLCLIKLDFVQSARELLVSNHATFLVVALVCIGAIYLLSNLTYRFIELPGIALGRKLSLPQPADLDIRAYLKHRTSALFGKTERQPSE